jgi:hypothetical protein
MESYKNPYRPGAGTKPLVIAGRDNEIEKSKSLFKSVKFGAPQRSIMLYGLRGVGKTVLLNEMERISEEEGYISEHLEMSENDDFRRVIAKSVRKCLLKVDRIENLKNKALNALGILKAFSLAIPDGPELKIDVEAAVGLGDSGDLDSDLVDLFVALGEAAKEEEKYICFFIDEVQYLSEKAVAGLIASSHRISQKTLPVVFVCAGLPQVAAFSGDAKSYAERLFDFIPIGPLANGADVEAVVGPVNQFGVEYEPAALKAILDETKGYPYFLQEFGSYAWNEAEDTLIKKAEVLTSNRKATDALDRSFFKVRMDRATTAEKRFMKAMATLGQGPYKSSDVATKLGKQLQSIGPVRATLISKGFVFSPQHGEVDFTVPLYDEYIARNFDLSEFN